MLDKIDIHNLFNQFKEIYENSFKANKENFQLDILCKKSERNNPKDEKDKFFSLGSCDKC